ncbi:MAG: NPXTG-anchored protein [Ruminococcus sp.]
MKRLFACVVALALVFCAAVSVSAEVSPTATTGSDSLIVDVIPYPPEFGDATGGDIDVQPGDLVTLIATPKDGYKFVYWDFAYGEFEIVEGDLTTPTIVIKPTGDSDVKAYAHFAKIDSDVTVPSSKPVYPQNPDDQSPTTGSPVAVCAVVGSMILVSLAAAIIFKKKSETN